MVFLSQTVGRTVFAVYPIRVGVGISISLRLALLFFSGDIKKKVVIFRAFFFVPEFFSP